MPITGICVSCAWVLCCVCYDRVEVGDCPGQDGRTVCINCPILTFCYVEEMGPAREVGEVEVEVVGFC